MVPVLKKSDVLSHINTDEGFVLLIDKPEDWTSFDVVKKIRSFLRVKKAGHAGTLDPFATGLMLIGVSRGTKALSRLSTLSKRYRLRIRLGIATDTYDRTGSASPEKDTSAVRLQDIKKAMAAQQGTIMQVPPMFSAKRVNGQRLYTLARKNIEVEREAVPVTIFESVLEYWDNPFLGLELHVSKGTYVRSYAHELGAALGVGGHVDELRRTAVDDFEVGDSFTINEFITYWTEQKR